LQKLLSPEQRTLFEVVQLFLIQPLSRRDFQRLKVKDPTVGTLLRGAAEAQISKEPLVIPEPQAE